MTEEKTEKKPAKKAPKKKYKKKGVHPLAHGRPTKYLKEYDEQVFKYALLGIHDDHMADLFQVTRSTFYEWKANHPSFSDAIANGKEKADAEIANAMYHRAKGYEWEEDQIVKLKTGPCSEQVVTKKVKKKAVPDTNAASLWLRNRQREYWKDRQDVTQDVNHSGETTSRVKHSIDAENISPSQLEALKAAFLNSKKADESTD
jgi:hypothetical protein